MGLYDVGNKFNAVLIKIRDRVKEEYCSNKKVPLLRIHFEDKDVKEKVDHFLNPLLIK